MPDLPTGTVTFLFTDIEGSTSLLQQLGDRFHAIIDEHGRILREAIAAGKGTAIGTEGDSFFAVFPTSAGALRAVIRAQRDLAANPWPGDHEVRVRMGLHTGEGVLGGDNYIGLDVHRAARIAAAGHGGQVLLSHATRVLVEDDLPEGVHLRELGEYRLKDLDRPMRIHDLLIDGLPSDFPALKTADVPTNLPLLLSSFVGRERELDELPELIHRDPLITLTGPGGSGKTRLAVEAARQQLDAFPDGAFFVDLSSLTDASLVPHAIAHDVGVREQSGTPVITTLAERFRGKRMLLILDNCEHLLAACAAAAEALLRNAPTLTVLATSREILGIHGERAFPVPPLTLPAGDATTQVARSESARLFVERAAAVMPGFQITSDNASAIGEICRRLDGIPLAIELAAARTPVLSPQEIARRLEDRFRLLTTGGRSALPRQQTLQAMIRWSHDLLGPDERVLFRRLAVFAGGGTLEAFEAVCVSDASPGLLDRAAPLDSLAGLVTKSLLIAESGEPTRYRLLESIRAYAFEELVASGEEVAFRDRHLAWYADLSDRAEPELVASQQREWFDRLSADHDNLRAALKWGLEHAPRKTLAMAKSLYWFWQARGHATEGRAWLDAGLRRPEASPPDALRRDALLGAGSLAWVLGDDAAAERQLNESADIAAEMSDRRGRAIALAILGHSRVDGEQLGEARMVLQESLSLAREAGDPFVLARSLGTLADLARHEGNDDEALRTADEAIAVFEQIGMEEGVAFNLYYGSGGLRRRDPDAATARLIRAIDLFDKLDLPHGLYLSLLMLIDVSLPGAEMTARLLGALEVLRERTGFRVTSEDRTTAERLRADAINSLGRERFAALLDEGHSLPRGAVVSLARAVADRVGAGGIEPPTSAL